MSAGTFNPLTLAANHDLLRAERIGDALVITPQGDTTGYSRTTVGKEIQRINGLLESPNIKSVIVDLGGGDYFGAEMIQMFVTIRERLGDGRTMVLANPSLGMRMILEKKQIDQLLPVYDSRRAALKALVRRSPADWLRHFRKLLWPVLLLSVLASGWWVFNQSRLFARLVGTPESRIYCVALDHYHHALDLAEVDAPRREWKSASDAIDESLFPVLDGLDRRQDGTPSLSPVRDAVRSVWRETKSYSPPDANQASRMRDALEAARTAIAEETGLTLPEPRHYVEPQRPLMNSRLRFDTPSAAPAG